MRDPFALSQAIGLDDDRQLVVLEIGQRIGRLVECLERAVRMCAWAMIVFREDLAGFEPGRLLGGTENLELGPAKFVDDPQGQRRFRSDDGQIDSFPLHERFQSPRSLALTGTHAANDSMPAFPGAQKSLRPPRTLHQLPDEGMFTAAVANDKNFHVMTLMMAVVVRSRWSNDLLISPSTTLALSLARPQPAIAGEAAQMGCRRRERPCVHRRTLRSTRERRDEPFSAAD